MTIFSIIFASVAIVMALLAIFFLITKRLVLGALCAALALLSALGAVKAPVLILVIIFVSSAAILFGLLAFLFFKSERRVGGAVCAVLCLAFVLGDVRTLQIFTMISAGSKVVPPPETVTSAIVQEEDWAPVLSAIGSISPVQGAIISTELPGTVAEVPFESGAAAKKGDLIVKLDVSQEEALLRSSEAEVELARSDLERTRGLASKRVVSTADLDTAQSKFRRLTAVVDQMRSNIRKKTIVAPFDGQLGIRQVNVGQMINAGQQVVPLQALDQVFADFALPQQHFAKLSPGLEVHVTTDAVPGRVFTGKLTAINSMVDVATRNVSLQATLENPDHTLRPGMFAKVEVVLPEKHKSLVIPGSAISYAPFGDSVFVIEKKKDEKTGKESQAIRQQFVRVGEARGDFVSITTGLKAGETVVGTGVFKLRNGMAVTINNNLAPKSEIAPTPADT